jgi:hypothetical protein
MANQIVKILFRSGTDIQRRQALGTGITFTNGEPAWVVDSKRLYVGDGDTTGGIPVASKNFGSIGTLFGNYGGTGLSQEAYFTLTAAEIGDFIYDRETRSLYSLSSKSGVPPLATDFQNFNFTILVNPDVFYFNAQEELQIQQGGITPQYISQGVAGGGLIKYDANAPITIAVNGVDNSLLATMPPNTVKVNPGFTIGNTTDMTVEPGQFIGRSSTSSLTALDFSVLLAEANFEGNNGVIVNRPTASSTTVSLCSNVFLLNTAGTRLNIFPTTTINSPLSVAGDINNSGRITATGAISAGGNLVTGGTLTCGNVTCGTLFTQGNDISTGAGNLNVNNVFATGDITAFYTSDIRLKDNTTPISNALASLDKINGYTFTWNTAADKTGDDIGLIAQEIQSILPQTVNTKSNGYLGVDYQRIVPYLVSCLKELKQEVESLRGELNAIRSNS